MKDKESNKSQLKETESERTIRRNKEQADHPEKEREDHDDEKTTLSNDVDSDPVKPGYGI